MTGKTKPPEGGDERDDRVTDSNRRRTGETRRSVGGLSWNIGVVKVDDQGQRRRSGRRACRQVRAEAGQRCCGGADNPMQTIVRTELCP